LIGFVLIVLTNENLYVKVRLS